MKSPHDQLNRSALSMFKLHLLKLGATLVKIESPRTQRVRGLSDYEFVRLPMFSIVNKYLVTKNTIYRHSRKYLN